MIVLQVEAFEKNQARILNSSDESLNDLSKFVTNTHNKYKEYLTNSDHDKNNKHFISNI